jgi:hypothetical protein
LLRNNQALSRQSFLEFDLEAMFSGELYSDFVLLWLVAHATRFAPRESDKPETCWLEQWTKLAEEQGTRALGELRGGVEKALQILGEGFTSHTKNTALRDGLRTGQVSLVAFHGQLLRVVYRLIFLLVAEDRTLDGLPLLHPRDGSDPARTARERFALHYGTARLREMAAKIKGSRHSDLWRQFQIIVGALSGDANFTATREALALPALGSFLWDPSSTSALKSAELANHDFLEALRDLAFTRQGKVLRPVDYENLGAEELGGVYESLLALTPQISADGSRFTFAEFAGNERKTSGSYYTPDSLVQCLLDSALDPVVEEAIKGKSGPEAEKAILALRVCDPAVGSGHFLVGAAHRLALHLARVRASAQGESEPSPLLYQHALRDVIGRCLYGVDMNPMAAELCRVSLWLEALEPGKPLSFLDHHIRVGNSLLGATPELLAAGIPDDAFSLVEGDDRKACAVLKKRNKSQRETPAPLFAQQDAEIQARLETAASALEAMPDDRPDDVRVKELAFRRHEETAEYRLKKQLADTWCAAFMAPKYVREPGRESSASGITQGDLHSIANKQPLLAETVAEVKRLTEQYRFFHWHLAFPEIFARGGFDCVLGNPPWDKIQPEEEKFFATIRPDIANAASAQIRKDLISRLEVDDPPVHALWLDHQRGINCVSHFVKHSGRYPLSSEGNLNSYRIFAELSTKLLAALGRAGLVVQTAFATGESGKELFDYLLGSKRLIEFLDFENRGEFFEDVHAQFRFCLATICGVASAEQNRATLFGWLLHSLNEIEIPGRLVRLSSDDLQLFNPSSKTCPIFTSERDFLVSQVIYRNSQHILLSPTERFANISLLGELFNLTRDSRHFKERALDQSGPVLPLFEAKYIHQFDHRFATASDGQVADVSDLQKRDGIFTVTTAKVVDESEVTRRLSERGVMTRWLAGFRRISSGTNERTAIMAVFPVGAIGNTINLAFGLSAIESGLLVANVNSFAFDFCCRQKVSGTDINIWIFKQLPVVPLARYSQRCAWGNADETVRDWFLPRILELTYTAWDLEPYAEDCGLLATPFCWDEGRRFSIRCELDAAWLHLYLGSQYDWRQQSEALIKAFPSPKDAVSYIMDTFPIVRRKDEEEFGGEYRTKRLILEIYDAMQESMRTGQPYQTLLDPPSADPRCRHPKLEVAILAFGSLINDPGDELNSRIVLRLKTQTPFPIEYGRYSGTRGGAPTLVPHQTGAPVAAEILVLDATVTVDEATDMLWRRERRKVGSDETYVEGTSTNSVLVRQFSEDPRVSAILYTDFHDAGKIPNPTAGELAEHAIHSVEAADEGKDGITYLINAIKCGIETPLTRAYRDEILRQTNTPTLEEALSNVKEEALGRRNAGRHE